MDREKVIKGLEETEIMLKQAVDRGGEMAVMGAFKCLNNVTDALALLKEQEAVEPKTGHWLKKMQNYPSAIATGGSGTSACDLCGGWGRKSFKYCPRCGAKMEETTGT